MFQHCIVALCCLLSFPVNASEKAADLNPFEKPKVILIIDDLGDNYRLGKRVVNLPVPLNLSLLPHTPFARKLAEMGFEKGHDIMLHFPMEANSRNDLLGKGALTTEHGYQETLDLFHNNLRQIPHVKGFNNHMGSRMTQSWNHMDWLFNEAKHRQLYFVDSRTISDSIAYRLAKQIGLPSLGRDVFLDPVSKEFSIEQQLVKALQIADEKGMVVIIGHPLKKTLGVLERELPYLKEHYDWQTLSAFFKNHTASVTHAAL